MCLTDHSAVVRSLSHGIFVFSCILLWYHLFKSLVNWSEIDYFVTLGYLINLWLNIVHQCIEIGIYWRDEWYFISPCGKIHFLLISSCSVWYIWEQAWGHSAWLASVQHPWTLGLKALFKGPQTCNYSNEAGSWIGDLSISSTEAYLKHTLPHVRWLCDYKVASLEDKGEPPLYR